MNIEQARFNMVEQQIRPWNVASPKVLQALSALHREDFVPHALRDLAFADMELSLGAGEALQMLAPKIEARILQDLDLQGSESVLLIGAGSGYLAGLLGRLSAKVCAYECQPEWVCKAQQALLKAGLDNVTVLLGQAPQALVAEARFDAIVLAGSVAAVPESLLERLLPGGRLWAVVGSLPVMQATLYTRLANGRIVEEKRWETVLPALQGFAPAPSFTF